MHTHTSWRLCNCDPCRTRVRTYNRDMQRARRSDPLPRLIDVTPTRDHLRALLDDGWTLQALAQHTGYPRDTLATISAGRTQRIRPLTAEDILSVPVRAAA